MKILFLNTNIDYAGATKIMLWLAGKLADDGHIVTFLTYRDAVERRPIPKGVDHIHIQLETSGHSLRGVVYSVQRLRRYIKATNYDLGIAFLSPSHLRLSLAAIGTTMKVLISQRGDPYQSHNSRSFMLRLCNYAFKRADMYVFQTPQAMAFYNKTIQSRGVVIPNPVKPLKRTCERRPDNRIVNVARLDINQKRQDLLIDAFKIISQHYPELSLHFYGDGDDEKELKKLAIGQDRIYFEGVTSDVVEDIQNARLFVLSSDFEGIPNALIEAMSLGVPCISTRCSPGGAELLITDGKNGLLAPCGDARVLSEIIMRFLEDSHFAEKCGMEAKKIEETFSEERIFHLWTEFISKGNG